MWERVPNIAEVCEHSDSIIESKKLFHRCGQTNDILLSQNSSSGITSQIVWKTFDLKNIIKKYVLFYVKAKQSEVSDPIGTPYEWPLI